MAVTSSAQVLTTLASFNQANGSKPEAPLVQGSDGNFYGTTSEGGSSGSGSIFRITPSGTLTILYSFCAQHPCLDGSLPKAGLVQGTDGNFYGTTSVGGSDQGSGGEGTVFKITPEGTLNTLYRFCVQQGCTDGGAPLAGLVQGSDGNFYGTTSYGGGPNLDGTVFKITRTGSLTTLYNFCSLPNCADGYQPRAGLVQATNGDFYGTTSGGGENNCGTVFKITSIGALTTLYSFCALDQRADGGTPQAGLVQATNGNLYGTTSDYGANYGGTIFTITPSGTLTTLYSLNPLTDGTTSVGSLLQATDGNFYGTTSFTGDHGGGTAFKITPSGVFTTLYSFCSEPNCSDGTYPHAGLLQGSNGNFYGTTEEGGTHGPYGTVFTMPAPTPHSTPIRYSSALSAGRHSTGRRQWPDPGWNLSKLRPSAAGTSEPLRQSLHRVCVFVECDGCTTGTPGISDDLAYRREPTFSLAHELAGWQGQSQCCDRGGRR
jgi:uncharacterized repeat protein (TIGR03803 family)